MRNILFKIMLSHTLFIMFGIMVNVFPASADIQYSITDLGPGIARDINNLGQVVGGWNPDPAGFDKSFYWDSIGGRENLDFGQHGGFESINDSGEAICNGWPLPTKGLLWNSMTGITIEIPLYPEAINNSGQVAGEGTDGQPCIWDSVSGMQCLNDIDGTATDIGDSGQICVNRSTQYNESLVWDSVNGIQYIPTLGGADGEAKGINNLGQVVGASYYDIDNTQKHSFTWDNFNGTQDLGTVYGYNSEAFDINILGQVVGRSSSSMPGGGWRGWIAFIQDSTNGMQDLNDLIPPDSGWILGTAFAINDQGQIVGYGSLGGEEHAFILTPVSVPTYTFIGFEPPCDSLEVALTVEKNKCIPLKTELNDENGAPIIDADIEYPPVLVLVSFAGGAIPSNIATVDGLPPSQATDGNQFEFIGGRWCFNLKVKDYYTAPGTYTFKMMSGNQEEYAIEPTGTVKILVEK